MHWWDAQRKLFKKEKLDTGLPVIVLTGPSGTGKTSFAYLISKVCFRLEMTITAELQKCSQATMTASYVGGTPSKVEAVLKAARGRTLFWDEAYACVAGAGKDGDHSYGKETIAALLPAMEGGQTVFIFAGYTKEMNEFIDVNEGFEPRVTHRFTTVPCEPADLAKILMNQFKSKGLDLDKKIDEAFLQKKFESVNPDLRLLKNARLAEACLKSAVSHLAFDLATGKKGKVTTKNVS